MATIQEKCTSILKEHWGYKEFRPGQYEIIEDVINKNDTLALLPTGGGKSICYQVPALYHSGTCLVISPLIALMQDQHNSLVAKGISSICLGGIDSKKEIERISNNWLQKAPKFIFTSPERLSNYLILERLKLININYIVYDEAHCISHWGHQFRPMYRKVGDLKKHFPTTPMVALTATATKFVQDDIINTCKLSNCKIHKGNFLRKNLSFIADYSEEPSIKSLEYCLRIKGTKIIYCQSRKGTEQWANYLNYNKIVSHPYHAGLAHKTKEERSKDWLETKVIAIAATNAFGMGIDKPDVKLVIHPEISQTPEDLYQEAGRAGRDGNRAFAVAVYNDQLLALSKERLVLKFPTNDEIKRCYTALANYFKIAMGSKNLDFLDLDLHNFCNRYNIDAYQTLKCLELLQKEGWILLNDKGRAKSNLEIIVDNQNLYNFKLRNQRFDPILETLVRAYPGIVGNTKTISEEDLAKYCKTNEKAITAQLKELETLDIVQYKTKTNNILLSFIRERTELKEGHLRLINELRNIANKQYEFFHQYFNDKVNCRQVLFAKYFDTHCHPCENCDNCNRRKLKNNLTQEHLIKLLSTEKSFEQLTEDKVVYLFQPESLELLDHLVREEKVLYQDGKYYLK